MSTDGSNGNGSNGHSKRGVDLGLHEEIKKPCCKRFDFDRWCNLDGDHQGPCSDGQVGPVYGPRQSIWHQHRGMTMACGKVVGDDTFCPWPRGHSGPCTKTPPRFK